jgi:hypothetical protein
MNYRIKETTDLEGGLIFVPQYSKFFIFWDFWDTSFPPHKIFFRSHQLAKNFIELQRNKPREKYYEV